MADLSVEVGSRPSTTSDRAGTVAAVSVAHRRLQAAVRGRPPLHPLNPVEYAAGHALFEGRSDQRAHVTAWLVDRLDRRARGTSRVLSVGCGDGSLDVAVAAVLTAGGRRVDYVGVEPHAPSGRAFTARLSDVAGARVSVLDRPFELTRPRAGPRRSRGSTTSSTSP